MDMQERMVKALRDDIVTSRKMFEENAKAQEQLAVLLEDFPADTFAEYTDKLGSELTYTARSIVQEHQKTERDVDFSEDPRQTGLES